MKTISVPRIIREAIYFQNVAMKLQYLSVLRKHPIHEFLVDGIARVMDMAMKRNLPQSELIEGVDYFLELTADRFIQKQKQK